MPELPEIETIVRDLDREVRGLFITKVSVTRPDVLREGTARSFAKRVTGATIGHAWRRAKLAILDLSTGDRIVVQPRFTGALLVDAGNLPARELEYSTLRMDLADGRALHYRDIRRLGTVTLMAPDRFLEYTGALGVEPLEPEFTAASFFTRIHKLRSAIKKTLMDQRVVAGVGNIYASEALWRSGIDPSRLSNTLSADEVAALRDATVAVLAEAVEARGTSFRDYRDANGEKGEFGSRLDAYGRAGEPCRRCGRRMVGTHAIDGRITVFCATCQR